MAKPSFESISSLRVDGSPSPLAAPADLSEGAARIWRSIVAATPTAHFRASDAPLLRAYCEACAMTDKALAELTGSHAVANGKLSPWLAVFEKTTRVQNALAIRLRLCPSARSDPKTTARSDPPRVPQIDFKRL
jgi:phage terminase small subunit